MRVAYVSADLGVPIFGRKGCSIHAQEVLRSLGRNGAQLELFTCSGEGERPPGLEAVRLHPLPRPPKGTLAEREQAALTVNEVVRGELAREGPFELIYERYSLWSYAAMEFARECGMAGLLEVNAPLIEEQAQYRELIDRAGATRAAERAFTAARSLLAVSEEVAAYLDGFPMTHGKVCVVPNGINPERFPDKIMPTLPAPEGVFTAGFVGTLKAWHGVPVLVEAFAKLHAQSERTRLLIVGDGPEREKLASVLSEHGLSNAVQFTGAVAAAEVPGLIASMDVAAAPYPKLAQFYFSPLKVYEYLAAGVPVVASRIGQLEKLIVPEVNGMLVTPGDADELAAALGRLQSAPELRCRLGQTGRAMVLRDYTWDRVAQQIFRLGGLEPERRSPETLKRTEVNCSDVEHTQP